MPISRSATARSCSPPTTPSWRWTTPARVIEWNPAAVRTFGWTAWEAAGRDMGDLIVPPSLRDRHRAGLARYLGGGEPVVLDRRVEITAMRRDGTRVPVRADDHPHRPARRPGVRRLPARHHRAPHGRGRAARVARPHRQRGGRGAAPAGARPARRRAAAPRRPRADAAARAPQARARPGVRRASCSTRRSRTWPRHGRAARARARHPSRRC